MRKGLQHQHAPGNASEGLEVAARHRHSIGCRSRGWRRRGMGSGRRRRDAHGRRNAARPGGRGGFDRPAAVSMLTGAARDARMPWGTSRMFRARWLARSMGVPMPHGFFVVFSSRASSAQLDESIQLSSVGRSSVVAAGSPILYRQAS